MVDRVLADGPRRVAALERLERAVRSFGTELAFGDAPEPEEKRLTRAVANTLSSDVAGLITTAGVSESVAAALAVSLGDYLALIDAMRTAPLPKGSQPLVANPAPADVPPTDTQAGEKTELPTMTVSVDGSHRTPELIGATTDIGEGAWKSAGDQVVLRVAAAATIQTARWIVSKLSEVGTAATDIVAALAALEAAGWTPDLIVSSRSAFVTAVPGVVPTSYPSVVYGPTGLDLYVVSRAGIVCLLDESVSLLASEPHIGGHEVSVFRSGVFVAGTGAVQKVTSS